MKVGKPSYLIKSMYSSFYQLSYLVRSVGKFMVCLCHCLVKFAQKGGDESNISFESESEGLFISFSFVLVQFCVLLFCLFVFCLFCLFVFFACFDFKSCIAAKKFSDRERVRFDVIFPFSIENPTSSEDKENTDSAAANTDTFDAGVLSGMAETVAICWGGIKDKLEKVSSLFV